MVHTPFTWRYGGRQVYLCGSFNGWSERILMILVEGSSTVFQRILDLPQGYYQYKFLVDDVWRVDEQQICVHDGQGTINNVVFVVEPALMPPILHAPNFQLNPDFDNLPIMPPVASTPSGPVHDAVLQFPDQEIDVLRYHLSLHLSASKAYDLMPNSGKVVALDVDVAVRQAFHVMYEEGVAAVPLWDEQETQILGMLTASDFILILLQLHRNRATLTDEEIEMHTVSAWKDLKFQYRRNVGASEPVYRRALIQAGPDESLKDVALRILQNNISTIPIVNSTQDGSCPQLLCMACLAGILQYIRRHFGRELEILPLLQKPVCDLALGTWAREVGNRGGRQLLTLRSSDPLSSALNLLIQAEVSSIPIVDDAGSLVNVYSRSDIMSLAKGNVYARIQLDQTNMSRALEIVDVLYQSRYQTCTRFDSLFRVMELLSDPVVRRIIVIEAQSRRVEGIITLRDIFNFILN